MGQGHCCWRGDGYVMWPAPGQVTCPLGGFKLTDPRQFHFNLETFMDCLLVASSSKSQCYRVLKLQFESFLPVEMRNKSFWEPLILVLGHLKVKKKIRFLDNSMKKIVKKIET